jgi:hypothetical protein
MSRIRFLSALVIICFYGYSSYASTAKKNIQQAFTVRTNQAPVVDGIIEPEIWGLAEPIQEFVQYDPVFAIRPSQATEVRILYDDHSLYIAARLYDSSPDSILRQLGVRNSTPNADAFGIRFDTYNNQLDAYTFEVYASGVQRDHRRADPTYDGVWESAVRIDEKGWVVEMRIPYSALRFPATDCQTWGLQIYRNIRRHREMNQWALEEKNVSNRQIYWGQLSGICNIEAPLRLSLIPYISMGSSHYPHGVAGVNNYSGSFGGGVDLNYGINESFSFDMTLMPDFSQVPSDNQVKNLSAFETVHGEHRPFFKENMDLFQRGDLFYSRRIGGRPVGFSRAGASLEEGEVIRENPGQSRLVNAMKLSGRTSNGLGVGVFNAITGNTYATIETPEGLDRKVETDPTTNYSILVFDQALANNSSVYLINTNVLRSGNFRHANVTGAGATVVDNTNTWQVHLAGAFNQIYEKDPEKENVFNVNLGSRYNIALSKIKGNFQLTINRNAINPGFNDNDMGLTHRNNETSDNVNLVYHVFEPFWIMRNWRNQIRFQNQARYNDYKIENTYLEYNTSGTTLKYLHLSNGLYVHPMERFDYYEPRTSGRVFIRPKGMGGWASLSSDYRKPFALDLNIMYSSYSEFDNKSFSYRIAPRFRLNDQLAFVHSLRVNLSQNEFGFAGRSNNQVIFGNRDVTTLENTLTSDYIVTNDIYFSFRLRQYWSKGEYERFHVLQENGRLQREQYNFSQNKDFNFNSFNIDLVFTWLFAPGSSLNLVWKNAILHDQNGIVNNYRENFGMLFDSPQYNSLSLKVLYYLDYQHLRKSLMI